MTISDDQKPETVHGKLSRSDQGRFQRMRVSLERFVPFIIKSVYDAGRQPARFLANGNRRLGNPFTTSYASYSLSTALPHLRET